MTEEQIVLTLATKVMGWDKIYDPGLGVEFWVADWMKGDTPYLPIENWNPLQNIADAWMIVERFKNENDGILKAKFAVSLPVLIYKIEPADICYAALSVVA